MHPILFHIGHRAIYSYTVLLTLGLICGSGLVCWECRRMLGSPWLAIDAILLSLVGGTIGGRLGYVVQNHTYFVEKPWEALLFWRGGLAFWGAFPLGMAALAIYAAYKGSSFWLFADAAAPGLALGQAFGWLACLAHGCVYGRMDMGPICLDLPDIYGISAPRFPTQVMGIALSLIIFAILWLQRGHWPFRGFSFSVYILLGFGGQFLLDFTRGDEAFYVGPWRVSQFVDLGLVACAAGLLGYRWRKRGRRFE